MIAQINKRIKPYRDTLLHHPLYSEIKTPKHLQTFMEYHVFAVWDFMSLLKSLQNNLTCTSVPWTPKGDPETRYLINEIVLAEETDINLKGERQSHFEMYLDAMRKAKADTNSINGFLERLQNSSISEAIEQSDLPKAVQKFLRHTFSVIEENKPHKTAAAFTFGREDLIPKMFSEIIKKVQKNFPEEDLAEFKFQHAKKKEIYDIGLFGNSHVLMVGSKNIKFTNQEFFNFGIPGNSFRQSVSFLNELYFQFIS